MCCEFATTGLAISSEPAILLATSTQLRVAKTQLSAGVMVAAGLCCVAVLYQFREAILI